MDDPLDENKRSVYCGNLNWKVTEDVLYELFLQAGPVAKVTIPKDLRGGNRGYAFILFSHKSSVNYAVELLNGIELLDKKLSVKSRNYIPDEQPPQANPQDFTLDVSALTPADQPLFNLNALTPASADPSFMPPMMNMPFGNPMFNMNPFGSMPAYPSQMGDNNFNQDYQSGSRGGFSNNWKNYNNQNNNHNNRNSGESYERNYDRNQERNDWKHDKGKDRDYKRHDRDNNRGNRGHDRYQDRGYSRNEDRNFDRNRNRPERDFNERSSSKHGNRDFNRGYDRGNGSNDRNHGQSRKRDHSSSDHPHNKRRRY